MENTFNLKKFLVENKLTYNSKVLVEIVDEETQPTQFGMYLLFNAKTGKLENYMEMPDHKQNDSVVKSVEDKGQYKLHYVSGNDYNKFKDRLDNYKGKTAQELGIH